MKKVHARCIAAVAALSLFITVVPAFCGTEPSAGSGGEVWGANYFPDVPLVTHEGKKVRFFTDLIKGRVVAINFIYTNCPDACALETARLREVQKILGERVGRDVFLYSITIDPAHDTPQVLKEYAKKFRVGPGWLFLTGKEEDIVLLRKKFGLYDEEKAGENLKEHNLSQMIGNQKTGRWMKVSPYENPYITATQLGSWLHNWKLPPKEKMDYAEAPMIRQISRGEELFRTRCSPCHTIGAKDAGGAGKSLLGPDLAGVTWKRDRSWLTRWMKEPDKVLAEKDPLATALLTEYNNLVMPNLGLNDVEIQELFSYMEAESHRTGHHPPGGHHHEEKH